MLITVKDALKALCIIASEGPEPEPELEPEVEHPAVGPSRRRLPLSAQRKHRKFRSVKQKVGARSGVKRSKMILMTCLLWSPGAASALLLTKSSFLRTREVVITRHVPRSFVRSWSSLFSHARMGCCHTLNQDRSCDGLFC